MEQENKTYIAIDLKSFYASVECIERGLDPITTNLVVADSSRTEKTICLAVSPSLKSYGIPGRARLYEVVQKVKNVNSERKRAINNKEFKEKSYNNIIVKQNPFVELDYIVATPRMSLYMKYSTTIYDIYLKYFSEDDIIVYSVDEIFCDITHYLNTYKLTPEQLITKVLKDVYNTTGITATAGIGTNLYLCKIAMDIVAKHTEPNENGVRMAYLDEMKYRKLLWDHKPLTDFWRVGKGYAKRLEKYRIYTMGDIARISVENEELLYKLFGINAELLIDHSWGWEPCTVKEVKAYKPSSNSLSLGQVLHCPYNYEKTKIIVKEMTESLTLQLVEKRLVTSQIVLTVGYDVENLKNPSQNYNGDITTDRYGRQIPKHAHGTINLDHKTSSTKLITEAVTELYERIINKDLLVRRINVVANNVIRECDVKEDSFEQINLFTNFGKLEEQREKQRKKEIAEKEMQKAILRIKQKYGKNAILKGMNYEEGATMRDRNGQIGGHKG